jgi:hypothetical protein
MRFNALFRSEAVPEPAKSRERIEGDRWSQAAGITNKPDFRIQSPMAPPVYPPELIEALEILGKHAVEAVPAQK